MQVTLKDGFHSQFMKVTNGNFMKYKHIKCECGGIIGSWDRYKFVCEKCQKEYNLWDLKFDCILSNDKTGWQFPMKYNGDKNEYD